MLRAFFVSLSENRPIRGMAERSSIGRKLSSRFVAGTSIQDAVSATQAVNQLGMHVSLDNLGENVANPEEARHSAKMFQRESILKSMAEAFLYIQNNYSFM